MRIAKPAAGSFALIAGMLAVSALVAPRLPAGALLPTHWSGAHPDGFATAPVVLVFMPTLATGLAVLFAILPAMMPAKARLERSEVAYQTVWVSAIALLAIVHGAILASSLGITIDVARWVLAGAGALLIGIGNLMGKIRYNYVFGVRTPWTLADERVWDRTHRFMGPVLMLWGLAIGLAAIAGLDDLRVAKGIVAGGAGLVAALAVGHSYLTARRTGVA